VKNNQKEAMNPTKRIEHNKTGNDTGEQVFSI